MFISGIASGIDTEALINELLAIERRPMVQMQQRKELLGQQRDAWRDVNTRLNNLRERMGGLRTDALFVSRVATSSNEDAVKATASSKAAEGSYEIIVTGLAEAQRVRSDQFDATEARGLAGTVKINDVEIEIVNGDSLNSIAQKINDAEDARVTATVIDGHLVLRANETGVANEIQFEDAEGVMQGLGLINGSGAVLHELTAAQDAVFTVEGIEVTRLSNTITDLFDGVTFTLHDAGTAVVTVDRNFDDVVNSVKAFVDQYNSVQTFISSLQASNPEQGQKGLLSGDNLLMRIQSQLRTGVTGAVAAAGPYSHLMSVGVSVDRYGKMTLDESKFREALADDADAVQRLFGAEQDADGFDGVAVRLEATFQGWLEANTGVLAERQKMFGDRMRSIEQSMERLETRLEIRERSLLRQFTALEEVMATFQTQATWLEGQIQQLNAMAAAAPRRR